MADWRELDCTRQNKTGIVLGKRRVQWLVLVLHGHRNKNWLGFGNILETMSNTPTHRIFNEYTPNKKLSVLNYV